MYRPGKSIPGPPPFGPPPLHGPPFRLGGPCGGPRPGHLPAGPGRPFSLSPPDSHFPLNRPPSGHFIRPHCSSVSIDHSTVIALGGRQQIGPPAEPPHTPVPHWNPSLVEHHVPDNSDQAGEEFLRCIAANKPLPDYLKGNMAYNLADAYKSANILKEAVKSDPEFQKHVIRSKSRSRSRSRSRGRSRAKSRARSKGRARSRSRGRCKSRGRGKSRARSKSRAQNRSRGRSKSSARSRSHSQSRRKKSHARSKSRIRRSKSRSSSEEKSHGKDRKRKRSPSQSCSSSGSSSNVLLGNSLLEGLKLVMNSKELEERLPTLKDAILSIKASDENKKVERVLNEQHESPENSSLENDSMLLPHERVGSDFSWLQESQGEESRKDSDVQRADEFEDEESFLYGNEDGDRTRASNSAALFPAFSHTAEHAKSHVMDHVTQGSQQIKSTFSSFGNLLDLKQPLQMTPSSLVSVSMDSSECDKIKNILKSVRTADISEIMVKMQGQMEEGKQPSSALPSSDSTAAGLTLPALNSPNVRQALESLQSLIKATKEKRTKMDGSGTSQTLSVKHKADEEEEKKKKKQARMNKMESLVKELEGLLKQDGLNFLTPVIGFYCQECEEFIGDLNSAEKHAARHCQSNSSSQKAQMDNHPVDSKGHHFSSSSMQDPHSSNRKDHWDYGYCRDSKDHKNHKDPERDWRDQQSRHNDDHRSHRPGQESTFLIGKMKKERMLITVSHGLTAAPNVRVKEDMNKEQAIESHSKVKPEDTVSTGKSSKNSRETDKVKDGSSDRSDRSKGKSAKTKSSKKKKKKEKKKKKKGDRS